VRTLGLVPARGGSKRLARKNLADLEGETLTRRTLTMARRCPDLALVALSTEDPEIAREAHAVDGVVVIERPAELATDDATAHAVVVHALAELRRRGEPPFDVVALIQVTSPFTEPADITATLRLLERTRAGSAATIVRLDHALQPQKLKLLCGHTLVSYLEEERAHAHQDLPELWIRNGSVYAAPLATIEAGRLMTQDQVGQPMPRERSLDINDQLDLEFARFLAARTRLG
jgi:CMP-N-acetylneuraminic acid synthetase